MKRKKIIKYSLFSLFSILVIFLVAFGGYSIAHAKKVYSSQYLGEINLAGKSKDDLNSILTERSKDFLNSAIVLKYQDKDVEGKVYNIKPEDIGLKYDVDATTKEIWGYGRDGKIFVNFWQQLRSTFSRNNHDFSYSVDDTALQNKISEIGTQLDTPEKDFSIEYKDANFVLNTEQVEGKRINQSGIINAIKLDIGKTNKGEIIFGTENFKPQVSEDNARTALKKANQILSAGDLTLKYGDQTFVADKDTIGGLVKSEVKATDLVLVMNEDRANSFISLIAKSINTEPVNAKLSVVGGKATIFSTAVIGKVLDQQQTRIDIGNSLFARITGNSVKADPILINLKVDTKNPEVTNDAISTMGITELVGTGTTDFRSSPANRVHNIQIGTDALNGSLLKPGETFSTIGKLGEIDAASGYLPELVIKNNETVPDFGGGLCQVSTTLFRAVMNAGLKITERQNHSYRVSYYEPPIGMDATIYDPSPDFKFINNYDHYLLIQSHINGTKITFDIYGTKDSRVVEISTPESYDVVNPPAAVTVETNTLPAGTRVLNSKAHQGITAKFNYKVTKDGNVLQDKTFVSKYTAIAERWLVGTGGAAPTCTDAIQNGDETGTDCGGSCPNACPAG